MKKIVSLLLFTLLMSANLYAEDISMEQALQIASRFATVTSSSHARANGMDTSGQAVMPTLAHAVRSKVVNKDNVYVVNLGQEQGFVVISGESGTADEIIGFCDHGTFNYQTAPVQMKELLDHYSASIDMLRQKPALAATASNVTNWPSYIGMVVVGPLLTTTWNQWGPYNNYCPDGCPSGCYPTALAQVMNYWQWPQETMGEVEGEDFSGHTYDWNNMLDSYGSGYDINGEWVFRSYDAAQAEAVAKLMADIGKAFNTTYNPEGSSTFFEAEQLVKNFGYEMGYKSHYGESAADLMDLMKEELDQKRPVLYSGCPQDDGSCHALVCDGYTTRDYFHFNYGWGGECDGFYKFALVPMFSANATIFTGIRPYDAEHKVINDIEYGLLKNGNAEVLEYKKEGVSGVNIDIPATVTGNDGKTYKVTRIRKHAFYLKGHFGRVTLGENIEAIDVFAFINSTIDELVLSDKMVEVPDEAFQLTDISKLTIGASIKKIGRKAFYSCPLSQVICKSPAFEVGEQAFAESTPDCGDWLDCIISLGTKAFAGVRFEKGDPHFAKLEKIGSKAFAGISFSEKQFVLPPKLKSIAPDAFYGSEFYGFEDNEENPYFCVANAYCLYNKKQTSLVLTPLANWAIGDDIPFPENLVKMEPGSITSRRKASSYNGQVSYYGVTIPATVVDMEGAFNNCETLSKLTCLAVIPPIISDSTFNYKIFVNSPDATLYVPEGTEDAYRNAPGWRRFTNIIADQEYAPVTATDLGSEYYMVMHRSGNGLQDMRIPIKEVVDIRVDEGDGQKTVVVTRSGKETYTTTIASVDCITWETGIFFEDAEVFDLNESQLTAEGQNCSVTLSPTVIDGDVQLAIRQSVLKPNIMKDCLKSVTVDISLSNGVHELSGTADISIPISCGADEKVLAAYYNEETGKWDPVLFKYDKDKEMAVITTDHLTIFGVFVVKNEGSPWLRLTPLYDNAVFSMELRDALIELQEIVSSDDPDYESLKVWKDDISFWQTVGIDGGWNLLQGLGFSSDAVNNATTLVGRLGTATAIFDVINADVKGDDIGVVSNSLKAILGFASSEAASAVGTSIMSASMGLAAFIGVALEKFGTMVQESKKELFRVAYRLYYTEEGRRNGARYRSTKDWYDYFYPAFENPNMTKLQLDSYIHQSVSRYCDRFWEDENKPIYNWCVAEAKAQSMTSYLYPEPSMKQQICDDYYAELMNGRLDSVFRAIKKTLAVKANDRCKKALKDYLSMVNTYVGIQIVDLSCKEGEKSKYAGWTIRFSEIPGSAGNKEDWERTITDEGRAKIGYFTEYTLIANKINCRLTLVKPNGMEVADYPFKIPAGTGRQVITIDLSTGGESVETPHLAGLKLEHTPDSVVYLYPDYREDRHENGLAIYPITRIYFDNSRTMHTRFQAEIEKFFKHHDFITVDASGNIKIGDDVVGAFENNGNKGTGKFTINTKYQFTEQTIGQFVQMVNNDNDEMSDYRPMNGTLEHNIDCEFTITRSSTESKEYDITYKGEGTYDLQAEVIWKIANWNSDLYMENKTQTIETSDVYTTHISGDGKVKLEYSTTLTE